MNKSKDFELGKFNDGSYVFRQVPYLTADDVLFTASLEDRLNTPVEKLKVEEEVCRCIPCKSDYDLYEFGSTKYELGHELKRGAFKVWVVSIKGENK